MDDTYQGVLQVARAAPHVVIRQCAVLGSVCALFALAVPAHAQDRSVVVERRDGDGMIARNGDVRLVETWTVRFIGGPFHFAYRAIPLNRVESIDGWGVAENGQAYGKGPNSAGERYFVVDNSGNQSKITWYFPPTTDQARTFTLSYTLHGALRIYGRGDQFFWKIVESDRAYPINAARVIVHLPAAFPADQIRATTYLNGQEDVSGARRINAETVSFQGGPFAPGQEWEIRTQFPHGAVTASAPAWQVREQRARLGMSGTPNILKGVACPRPSTCVAVGYGGAIVRTTNGGRTWRRQPSGTPDILNGVACPRPSTCVVVGFAGTIVRSTDGGRTWRNQPSGTTSHLYGVACPRPSTCVAVGASTSSRGTIVRSTDEGSTWRNQPSATTNAPFGVACPRPSTCVAVGVGGTIVRSTDGGRTWRSV